MTAKDIYAQLSTEEKAILARYYKYTLGQTDVPHDPRQVAAVLLKLTMQERLVLTQGVRQRFDERKAA